MKKLMGILLLIILWGQVSFGSNGYLKFENRSGYYVPIKSTVEKLGGEVLFNAKKKTIHLSLNGIELAYAFDAGTYQFENNVYRSMEDFLLLKGTAYMSSSLFSAIFNESIGLEEQSIKPHLIAHGGGAYDGVRITNSKEAILASLRQGINVIEIDFLKTYDHKYVLGHDWGTVRSIYRPSKNFTRYDQYLSLKNEKFSTLGLEDLVELMGQHNQMRIITDVKGSNIEFLSHIAYHFPDALERFIPQIYDFDEYEVARELGFEHIIYTMYKVYKTDDMIIGFAQSNPLYAVTFGESRATPRFLRRLNEVGVSTYVHTINSEEKYYELKSLGATGVYTDYLYGPIK